MSIKISGRPMQLLLLSLLLNLFFSEAFGQGQQGWATIAGQNQIKVMAYNVENLFNTIHDVNKNDFEFLPKSDPNKRYCARNSDDYYRIKCFKTDWTLPRLKLKLSQIIKVIRSQGTLPDVLALEEVEGLDVVKALAKALGFDGFLIQDGPDERGIDVALLYRTQNLKLINWDLIDLSRAMQNPTRGILRAHFQMRGKAQNQWLAVFVNHWPSQAKPATMRFLAAQILKNEIDRGMAVLGPKNYHVVALGDFNISETEKPNAFYDLLLNPLWENSLLDAKLLSDRSQNPMTGFFPPGTYYYKTKKTWNNFDRILLSKSLADRSTPRVVPQSFRIFAPPPLLIFDPGHKKYIPWAYDHNADTVATAGFSDHFGVNVIFDL